MSIRTATKLSHEALILLIRLFELADVGRRSQTKMKSTLLRTLFLSTAAFGALLAFNPAAGAQEVSEMNYQAPASGMRPGIRYTTGAVTTAGWEKSLTDGDPNLRRWNWSAMTTYTQSCYNKVPAGAFAKKATPNRIDDLKPTGSIYVKPVQISPETYAKKRVQPGVIVVGNQNSNANVSAKLRLPHHNTNQLAAVPAKSYNVNYVNGSLIPSDDAFNSSRNVSGRLMRTQ